MASRWTDSISIVTVCACRSGCQTCSVKPRNGNLLCQQKRANTRYFGRGREQGQPLRRSLRQHCRKLPRASARHIRRHTTHTPRTACLAGLGGELADVLSSSRTSRVPPCTPARSTRQATPRQAQGALVIKVACSSLLSRNLISLSWCAHTTAQAADQVKRWLRISLDSIASKSPLAKPHPTQAFVCS